MPPLPCPATLLPILAAAASPIPRLWFLLPLVVVVSLVYSASRFESPERILYRAGRLCATILAFMGLVFVVLWLLSRGL